MAPLLVHDDREYFLEPGETLETDLGVLEVPNRVEPGQHVETHLGTTFVARELRGPDMFHHFERTGAPMLPRDVGLILGETGAGSGDRVLDAGTGTGVLPAYLANAGATVVTYERDPDRAAVARDNMRRAGFEDAVDVRTGNILAAIDELAPAAFDAITLDMEDAADVVASAPALLGSGGFVAAYSPFIEQARAVAEAARSAGLSATDTSETIQRTMDFDDRGSRPSTAPVGHTGYLTVAREG